MKRKQLFFAAAIAAVAFGACKKDQDLPDVDENELITTMQITFTNKADAKDVQTCGYVDKDGTQGPGAPVVTGVTLKANSAYSMVVSKVLDESKTPADNTLDEIKEKSYEHLFVYTPTGVGIKITPTDKDKNNLPIGITNDAATQAAAKGSLKVQLRHQPNAKNGTAAPGSDDINVDIPVTLQ